METNKILTSNVLDIIFDGKNKQYGAYELRNTYNNRLSKALLLALSLTLVVYAGTVFASNGDDEINDTLVVDDLELSRIKPDETMPVLPPPTPPVLPEPNQAKFTTPVIVIDKSVTDEEKIIDITPDMMISSKTVESKIEGTIAPPIAEIQTQVFETPKVHNEDTIYVTVKNEAQFPGGAGEWKRYLERHLDATLPINNGAPEGIYRVMVQFIVSKDGTISNVEAETKHGFGMEEEAVKIIKRGPKWTPAFHNGHNVNAYRRQPITFLVQEN